MQAHAVALTRRDRLSEILSFSARRHKATQKLRSRFTGNASHEPAFEIVALLDAAAWFSIFFENHAAAVALYFMYYNFGRVHQTLRVTPAMEAGLADHVWAIEEIVALLG